MIREWFLFCAFFSLINSSTDEMENSSLGFQNPDRQCTAIKNQGVWYLRVVWWFEGATFPKMVRISEHPVSSWQHIGRVQPCCWARRVYNLASLPALTLVFLCADKNVTAGFLIMEPCPPTSCHEGP